MEYVWLCLSAFTAGVINSVAGGGTLLTFPTLIFVLGGTPAASVIANATSTTALLPGSLGSLWGYRRELVGTRKWVIWLLPPSIIGGTLGSWLLIVLPADWFQLLVPWLILTATSLLAFQPWIARWTGIGRHHDQPPLPAVVGIITFQFIVSTYGGYFGAGIGILMLSAMAIIGIDDFHRMNALKALFGSAINLTSTILFVVAGEVSWAHALPMAVAAVSGGFFGAAFARRLDRTLVRRSVVIFGFGLAAHYFSRFYGWW